MEYLHQFNEWFPKVFYVLATLFAMRWMVNITKILNTILELLVSEAEMVMRSKGWKYCAPHKQVTADPDRDHDFIIQDYSKHKTANKVEFEK